jgi:hypothetical protein
MPNEDFPIGDLIDTASEMPTGLDSWLNFDWGNLGGGGGGINWDNWFNTSPDAQFSPQWQPDLTMPSGGWDPPTGWPGNIYGPDGVMKSVTDAPEKAGGGGTWDNILNAAGKGGLIFKNIAEPGLAITRAVQQSDYDKNYAKWVKAQNDYVKQKQQYDADVAAQFAKSKEEFGAANERFQGQIEAASGQANEVLNQYLSAAKPLLAQSQELLVPGVAALARGEVPEAWQPLLEQAKQRAIASAVQSMVSAGMSEQEARASITPKVDQDAHQMLLSLATSLISQGLATGAQGGQFLQGAGQMTSILGQLAAAGMGPMSQEFQAIVNLMGHVLSSGPSSPVPPGKPTA